jgi:hypothetical protein
MIGSRDIWPLAKTLGKVKAYKPSSNANGIDMTSEASLIQDIHSIQKLLKQCEQFEAIRNNPKWYAYFKQNGVDLNIVNEQCRTWREFAVALDRFNDLFSGIGWIAYWTIDVNVLKKAVAKGDLGDIAGAQADLVRHYDPERVRFELKRMRHIKAFEARMPLARKALIDYQEERYHACIPVVLALLDGMVNEIYQKVHKKRYGFFAEDVDLIAWDSIAAHSKGLNILARAFRSGRYATTTDIIDIPYRNGILHGMDLGYDNKIVAAKTWAALFATAEWALKAEQGLLMPPQPEKEKTPWEIILEAIQQYKNIKEEEARDPEWKPRSIKPGQDIPSTGNPDDYADGTPERKLVDFLHYWKVKNYGYMAECIPKKPGNSTGVSPGSLRKRYDQNYLHSFELEGVCDTAPARTVIKAKLVYESYGRTMERPIEFILMNYDASWKPATMGTPESNWYVYNWDRYI